MALDIGFFYLLNGFAGRSPVSDSAVVFFASYFPYLVVLGCIGLLFFSQYPKQKKWQIFFVTFISGVIARYGITELIRHFYNRPRPFAALSDARQLLTDSAWSFPSGHAAFFFAIAMAIYLYNKRWGTWFFIAAILISIARVIAGVHYPSDILVGALVGALVTSAAFYCARRMIEKAGSTTY